MKAIRYDGFGEPADVLYAADVPLPEPGPGQVRVRLSHRSVNLADLYAVRGQYGKLAHEFPAVAGGEGMGTVDVLGDGVTGLQVGQRVIPLNVGETWQEALVTEAERLLPVADGVSDRTAAQFTVNPVAAWAMIVDELKLSEGDWLLQTAAASSLGKLVIQLSRLKGFRTINLVRRREQVQELLDLGADAALCTEDEDVVQQVMGLTQGMGVRGALDAVGDSTGAMAAACLGPGATMLVYGLLSLKPTPINTGPMIFMGTSIRGFWLVNWFNFRPADQVRATLDELMSLMESGNLEPPVEEEYDLADFRQAVQHAERSGRRGKILLTSL